MITLKTTIVFTLILNESEVYVNLFHISNVTEIRNINIEIQNLNVFNNEKSKSLLAKYSIG